MLVCPTFIGILKFVKMKRTHNHCSRGKIKVFWRLSPDTCTYSLWTMVCQDCPSWLSSVWESILTPAKHSTCIVQRGQICYFSSPVGIWKVWCVHEWLHCVQRYRPMSVLQSEWGSGVQRTKKNQRDLILHATWTTVGKMVWHIQLV